MEHDLTQIPDQASQALNADVARATYNVDGSGLTVGILSDSFDAAGGSDTMATDIANGYLPADTHILVDAASGEDEGRGMAEIVHEIAPGASILFATAAGTEQQFADNIEALAAHGAKVIVDDFVDSFSEPFYQDGLVAQAIAKVTSEGVIYLASASNDGNNGYEAPFNAGTATITHNGRTDTLHDFAPGNHQLAVNFFPGQTGTVVFELQWASPAASASPGHGATSDLDLYLVDSSGHVVQAAQHDNIGGDPSEELDVDETGKSGTYYLEVGLHSGQAPADFRIIGSDNDGGQIVTLDHPASSITESTFGFHFAAADVIAVGAARYSETPAFGQSPPHKEQYSSVGPDYVYYDASGNLLPTPEVRTIAVTGVDNADTSFFGDNDFDHDGLKNFAGTSAAAPSVAAVVALMLQEDASLTSDDARHLLQDSAIKMPNPNATGAGLVQADRAVGFAETHIITAFADGDGTLLGTHVADTLVGNGHNEVFTGYGGGDTFTGGGGADIFRDTAADLSGSTITDFGFNDQINLTDLNFSASDTASFSVFTHTLTIDSHTGTTAQIFLPNLSGGVFALSQDAASGTDIALQVNQPPVVSLGGTAADYIAGEPPVAIAPSAVVTDADSSPFIGGMLTAAVTGNASPQDQLSVITDSLVTLSGNSVSVGGAVVGTIDPVNNGVNGAALSIDFTTTAATAAATATLLSHIGFSDNGLDAPTAPRDVTFTVDDGGGSANGGNPTGAATATLDVTSPFGAGGNITFGASALPALAAGGGFDAFNFNAFNVSPFNSSEATIPLASNAGNADSTTSPTMPAAFAGFNLTGAVSQSQLGAISDASTYNPQHDVPSSGVDAEAHDHAAGWFFFVGA